MNMRLFCIYREEGALEYIGIDWQDQTKGKRNKLQHLHNALFTSALWGCTFYNY